MKTSMTVFDEKKISIGNLFKFGIKKNICLDPESGLDSDSLGPHPNSVNPHP